IWRLARLQTTKGPDRSGPFTLVHLPSGLFWRNVNQRAGIGVLNDPQRSVRSLCHVANAFAHGITLGRLGAALAVEDDPVDRLRAHAGHEAIASPLRERLA